MRRNCAAVQARETCGRNSVVECQLPKLNVVGSSPIARFQKSTLETIAQQKTVLYLDDSLAFALNLSYFIKLNSERTCKQAAIAAVKLFYTRSHYNFRN